MKTCTAFAAAAVVAMVSLDSTAAMKSFLKNFPNGDVAFTQALGHVSDSDTGLNDLGKLYSSKDGKWADLCKETFPGGGMTLGEAFGDPCCKWTAGAAENKVDAPFVKPTKKFECAANKPATPAATPAAAPAATPAPAKPDTPVVTPAPAGKPTTAPAATPAAGKPTDAPAGGAGKPTTAPAGKPTDAPAGGAGKPSAGKPSAGKPSKCGVKKESKSLEDETDDDDQVFDADY